MKSFFHVLLRLTFCQWILLGLSQPIFAADKNGAGLLAAAHDKGPDSLSNAERMPPPSPTATTYHFTADGEWIDGANWSPSYPGLSIGATDVVVIDIGVTCTVPTGILVTMGGTLINDGGCSFINNGEFILTGSLENYGDITNGPLGLWTGTGPGSTFLNGGNFLNEGIFNLANGHMATNEGGVFNNQSSLLINGGSVFNNGGSLASGSFQNGSTTIPPVSGTVSVSNGTFQNGSTFSNNELSSVSVEAAGSFDNSASFFNNTGASIYNNGHQRPFGTFGKQWAIHWNRHF